MVYEIALNLSHQSLAQNFEWQRVGPALAQHVAIGSDEQTHITIRLASSFPSIWGMPSYADRESSDGEKDLLFSETHDPRGD